MQGTKSATFFGIFNSLISQNLIILDDLEISINSNLKDSKEGLKTKKFYPVKIELHSFE